MKGDPLRTVHDTDGQPIQEGFLYLVNNVGRLVNYGELQTRKIPDDDEGERMTKDFPAYWKPLPEHWRAIDTYRVDDLFPLPSSRLYHTRKKLLVPGCRTGGKTVYQDLKEAHRTLGAWLAEQPEHQA
jgi:hypothetical protein